MGRKIREILAKVTYHTYSQCIDTQNLMGYNCLKDLMETVVRETQEMYDFELNSLSILDNHFHFLIKTNNNTDTISKIMQRIKSVFARRYNVLHGRTGPFWNARFGSTIIEKAKDATRYLLHLLWYIAYNPVRKGNVKNPRDYRYSVIRAYLEENYVSPLKVTLHQGFLNLGRTFNERVKYFLEYEKLYLETLRCQR